MTDKQVIIDCKYKFQNNEKFEGKPYCTLHNELCEDLSFACDDNCQIYDDYKQLARKTEECEELKSEGFTREELISIQEKDIARYRKALEEIEEICCQLLDDDYIRSVAESLIDIINKTEDGNNAR